MRGSLRFRLFESGPGGVRWTGLWTLLRLVHGKLCCAHLVSYDEVECACDITVIRREKDDMKGVVLEQRWGSRKAGAITELEERGREGGEREWEDRESCTDYGPYNRVPFWHGMK
jgi:hypothetical protein